MAPTIFVEAPPTAVNGTVNRDIPLVPFTVTLKGSSQIDGIDDSVRKSLETLLLEKGIEQEESLESIQLFQKFGQGTSAGILKTKDFTYSGTARFAKDGDVPSESEFQAIQKQILDDNGDELLQLLKNEGIEGVELVEIKKYQEPPKGNIGKSGSGRNGAFAVSLFASSAAIWMLF